jgi:signal transduction histidine kinase
MKILIAEDDPVSRKVLLGHLEKWGYAVTETKSGEEAWEAYQDGEFEMAILDWMMPGMDGIELVRRMRSQRRSSYTFVMLLSAKSQKEDIIHAIESGADDYVTKPFDRDELRVRVLAGRRILELQTALLRSARSAVVGQVALGLSQELSEPIAQLRDIMTLLRREAVDLVEVAADAITKETGEAGTAQTVESVPPLCDRSLEILARVQGTLRNLRDFARADEFAMKPIAIAPALEDVADMVRRLAATKAVDVLREIGQVPQIHGNAGKLKKVILNLLVNGIDAVERRGWVSLRVTHEEGFVVIRVEDNGHGIAPEHLAHIFEPFYALRLPADHRLGLGLAIGDAVVREHGGTFEVESVLNRGTTFTIRLPALPPPPGEAHDAPAAHAARVPAKSPAEVPAMA